MLFSPPVAEAPGTPDQDVHTVAGDVSMASKPSGPIWRTGQGAREERGENELL